MEEEETPGAGLRVGVVNVRRKMRTFLADPRRWGWDVMITTEMFYNAVPWTKQVVPGAADFMEIRTGDNEGMKVGEAKKQKATEFGGSCGMSIFIKQPLARQIVAIHKMKG